MPIDLSNLQPRLWNRVDKHFGEVAENAILTFTFEYLGDKTYKHHKAGCSCTTGKWEDNKLTASFDVGKLLVNPNAERFWRTTQKYITVTFDDGSTQKLSLAANIYALSDIIDEKE